MRIMSSLRLALVTIIIVSFAAASDTKQSKQTFLSANKETSSTSFITLLLMRLIFGLASVMGFRENLSGIMGGILVPPGADDYDDYNEDYLPELFRR